MYSAHTSITVSLQKIYHFIWNECLWDWLNPSICHDQQNTSPVREICVFGEKIKNNSVSLRFNDTYTALPSWKKILFSLTAWLKSFTKWGYDALGILKYVSVCILLRDRLSVISREYLPTYWPYWEKGLCNWKLKYKKKKTFYFASECIKIGIPEKNDKKYANSEASWATHHSSQQNAHKIKF